ncbi:carboxylate-amine ligase [Cribrihabitans marinus]|uniref:Putative glutamate--cysteine ligase 2 n=1 Tax=Cribrihabitans marinus TaxID=1227549 RepID=A0A1H6VG72_9RHOB|nr:carboxylate-amine ligase [Cribrihabitans marinus]GGH25796.1 putative glutamate--cysteine ligase 2 [Cribrihabitans marinus]SEJ03581.1 carboxylate-amine ligase [Cribrihabitans marinus]
MQTDFTIGIEEEYLLVDRDSLELAVAPEALMTACQADFEGQVSPEFLQCQIEVGTRVHGTVSSAREDLRRLRACVSERAAEHNLAPIAVSCHPSANWRDQHHTHKERYDALHHALGGVARRMLICGMHVHVGIEDDALRADLMPQLSYFLPHMLALSTSSPFWKGEDTRLSSYRLTVFDNLPRTGLPPSFASWAEYERTTGALIDMGVIEDSTKIWWDLRPSHRFPTLETRIMDVSPRMEHTLALAALNQAIVRMLCRLKARNLRWRNYDRFLIAENRWRAQRYGVGEGLIDFGDRSIKPMSVLMDELMGILAEDAEALGSLNELASLRRIAENGTSATRQRRVHAEALSKGEDPGRAVVQHLIDEFHEDL